MPTIGLRKPIIAPIVEEPGNAPLTYGEAIKEDHAISASLAWTLSDATLYGDDILLEKDNAILGGTLTFGLDGVSPALQVGALGTAFTAGGTADDMDDPAAYFEDVDASGTPVGFGYIRVHRKAGVVTFEGNWLYKVQFGPSNEETNTRGETIVFQTPSIVGTIMGVKIDDSGVSRFRRRQKFSTEAAALAFIESCRSGTPAPAPATDTIPQGVTPVAATTKKGTAE